MIHTRHFLLLSGIGTVVLAVVLAFRIGDYPAPAFPGVGLRIMVTEPLTTPHETPTIIRDGIGSGNGYEVAHSSRSHPSQNFLSASETEEASFTSEEHRRAGSGDPLIAIFEELEILGFQSINPNLDGHSLTAFGRRAAVMETRKVSGSNGVILSLEVEPRAPETRYTPPLSEEPLSAPAINNWASLSYEQELFRTKWGWQAFDQVQRLLRDQNSTQHTGE